MMLVLCGLPHKKLISNTLQYIGQQEVFVNIIKIKDHVKLLGTMWRGIDWNPSIEWYSLNYTTNTDTHSVRGICDHYMARSSKTRRDL